MTVSGRIVFEGTSIKPPALTIAARRADRRKTLDVRVPAEQPRRFGEFLPGRRGARFVSRDGDGDAGGLTGALVDSSGKPAPDLSILVFPTDRTLWNGSRRLRGPVQPAADGIYRVSDLPAGEYFLAALTDVEPEDLGDPAFLEQVAVAAIRVTIAFGETKRQDIRIR